MRAKAPGTKRRFRTAWEQIEYLYHKMLYWFYDRADRRQAGPFAERLRTLLFKSDPTCEAILGASARALLAEFDGDLWTAIRSREREIELLRRLIEAKAPPAVKPGPDDIADRLDLLASLYWEAGDLARAEETLLESQRHCARHGIVFDGQEMLDELRLERKSAGPNGIAGDRISGGSR
jgi:hypothetical protein